MLHPFHILSPGQELTSAAAAAAARYVMSGKRKREDGQVARPTNVVAKPAAGTRSYASGQAVKSGLEAGNTQCTLLASTLVSRMPC